MHEQAKIIPDPESYIDPEAPKPAAEHFDQIPDPYDSYTAPELYGNPKCALCQGRGRLPGVNPPTYKGPPSLRLCKCVLLKDIVTNMERVRKGLSKARKVPRSPLSSRINQDLRVAADEAWFEAHLRHVALRQSPMWDFRIVTDADLVQAWLATAAAKGMEIFDADVRGAIEMRSLTYMTLTDIAKSASLLIIRLGVKAAPNKEMPNVLLEAILTRKNEGLPTWLWEPSSPHFRLAQGHICWSEFIEAEVGDWEQVTGTDADLEREITTKPVDVKKLKRVVETHPTPPAPPPPPKETLPSWESSSGTDEYDPMQALSMLDGTAAPKRHRPSSFGQQRKGRR